MKEKDKYISSTNMLYLNNIYMINMKNKFTILITDKNPRIRKFIKRELSKEGYNIILAGTDKEFLELLNDINKKINLIIMDPDISDVNFNIILKNIKLFIKKGYFIIHCYEFNSNSEILTSNNVFFIKKDSNSIEKIKTITNGIYINMYKSV